jgi:hypothetical protein
VAAARAALGEEAFAAACAEGQQRPLAEIVAAALAEPAARVPSGGGRGPDHQEANT